MSESLDLRSASIDDLRGRDLSPAMIARAKAPKPTWFIKRLGDGLVFAVEQKEAWEIAYNRSSWKRNDFRFIGFSDGKTYAAHVAEAMKEAGKLEPQINALRTEIEKYRAAEEKLIINEAVDMDGDPEDTVNEENKQKVLRLRKILNKQENKLEELEKQHRNFTSDVVAKATAAEQKVAERNWKKDGPTWPEGVNIMTPSATPRDRNRILKAMNQVGD